MLSAALSSTLTFEKGCCWVHGLRMPCRTGNGSRSAEAELAKLLAAAAGCRNVVIFSGSGLSAPSGEKGEALRTHKARDALTAWSASQHEAGCACQLKRNVRACQTPQTRQVPYLAAEVSGARWSVLLSPRCLG